MKSALFVDFDNVYSGLRKLDPAIADHFATRPMDWVRWLAEGLNLPEHSPEGARRRLLVRRCYLNPQLYQRFRLPFNRAGFEIIDCPSMTSEGKNSTDIHMVLDIMDLLQHEARYDEFIVFSADADFTPVLRKLRRWDRRTTVLALGFPSAAYQASADLLINPDAFVREALGFDILEEDEVAPVAAPAPSQADVLAAITQTIRREVAQAAKPVALPRLASLIPAQVPGLDVATWAGFGNFRKLVDALPLAPLVVNWTDGHVLDPQRHTAPARPASSAPNVRDMAAELQQVVELISAEVTQTGKPVAGGRLATLIIKQHGNLAADWNGKGTFRKFLDSLPLAPLQMDWNNSGGYLFDPRQQVSPPQTAVKSDGWGMDKGMLRLVRQVHEATGVPLLSPKDFRALLEAIVADVREQPMQLAETGKRVRDRCRAAGLDVSREDANWVLRNLLMSGHVFNSINDNVPMLVSTLASNLVNLCRREQIPIERNMPNLIASWLSGNVKAD